MAETKKCPFCGEEIRVEAIRCRFCRSRLTSFAPERWHRSHPEARIAGVAAALAHAFAVPVAAVRVGFVVLTFFHLLGPLLYGGLWLAIPPRPGESSLLERVLRWGLRFAGSLSGGSHEPGRREEPSRPAESSPE